MQTNLNADQFEPCGLCTESCKFSIQIIWLNWLQETPRFVPVSIRLVAVKACVYKTWVYNCHSAHIDDVVQHSSITSQL